MIQILLLGQLDHQYGRNRYRILTWIVFIYLLMGAPGELLGQKNPSLLETLSPSTSEKNSPPYSKLLGLVRSLDGADIDSLLIYAEYAERRAKERKDEKANILSLLYRGRHAYLRVQYETAYDFFQKAKENAQKIEALDFLMEANRLLGHLSYIAGDLGTAVELYLDVLAFHQSQNNQSGMVLAYNDIGSVYGSKGDYEEALKFAQKSYDLAVELQDSMYMSINLGNMGNILTEKQEFDRALELNRKALEIRTKMGFQKGIAWSKGNIAHIFSKQGKYKEAISLLKEANEIQKASKNALAVCGNLILMAECYLSLELYSEAEKVALEALETSKAKAIYPVKVGAHGVLSRIYEQKNSLSEALFHHKRFKALDDSLLQSKNEFKISLLLRQFEFEQDWKTIRIEAEKERVQQRWILGTMFAVLLFVLIITAVIYRNRIKLQTSYTELEQAFQNIEESNRVILNQKEEIERKSDQLHQANESKNKLFAIIGHDLSSPIGSLTSALQLLESKVITPQDFQLLSRQLRFSVENIRFTLNNLLMWAQTQMQGIQTNIEKCSIQECCEETIKFLHSVAEMKLITISVDIKEDIWVAADKNQLKLILRNLINNAIKFTPEQGVIKIKGKRQMERMILSVEDSGVGIDKVQQTHLFQSEMKSTRGTNNEQGTGLGLKLCADFVQNNNGHIRVESELGKGSTFFIELPLFNDGEGKKRN